MCRSIKTLRGSEPVTDDEVRAAALQYVRKLSGYRVPAARNADAFDQAVDDVAEATRRLLDGLLVSAAHPNRPIEHHHDRSDRPDRQRRAVPAAS
jgi:hypothetical protein